MEKENKILEILDLVQEKILSPDEALPQILLLFSVSWRNEQFFKFIDEHYSHSSENYRTELKNSFAEWNLKNCH